MTEILVLAEHDGANVKKVTVELVTLARRSGGVFAQERLRQAVGGRGGTEADERAAANATVSQNAKAPARAGVPLRWWLIDLSAPGCPPAAGSSPIHWCS